MDAARYDRRLALEKPVAGASNGAGGTSYTWTVQATVAANIRFLRGTETVMAARLQGRQPIIATFRANDTTKLIDPTWRLRDTRDGTIYAVRGASITQDRARIEVLAESGVAA